MFKTGWETMARHTCMAAVTLPTLQLLAGLCRLKPVIWGFGFSRARIEWFRP